MAFTPGPSLKTARYGHSCGILKWFNPLSERLEDIVVVAGGFNGKVLTSVEYLYVDNIEFGFTTGPGKYQFNTLEMRCWVSTDG